MRTNFVQKIAQTFGLFRGNAYRMPESEFVEIEKNFGFIVIELIDGKNDRFARTTQNFRNVVIGGGKSRFRVAEENNDVRRFDGYGRLFFDVRPHFVLRLDFDSAGVYERERFSAPFRVGVKSVSRYARSVLHY